MKAFKLVKLWGETPEEIKANYNYLEAHGYSIHTFCMVDEEVFLQCKILVGNEHGDILRGYSNEHDDTTYQWFLEHDGEAIHFATPVHETGDGWFINSSGECPIAHDTMIDVRYRDGEELYDVPACASFDGSCRETSAIWWQLEDSPRDIIAWRYPVTCKGSLSEKCSNISGNEGVDMGYIQQDMVNNPSHYTSHPSNVECIEITRHMGFNLGNAMKYIWRCDLKKDAIEDLRKAIFYLNDEIELRLKQLENKQ